VYKQCKFLEIKHILPGEWRKLHNKEPKVLYSSPNIDWVIKSRRMRWAGHVARMVERRGVYRFWYRNLRERDHLGDPGIDGKIILRWIFRKWDVGIWAGSSWLRIGTDGGRECRYERSGFHKMRGIS